MAKRQVLHLYARSCQRRQRRQTRGRWRIRPSPCWNLLMQRPVLWLGQHDVRQPLCMQPQHPELDALVNQRPGTRGELVFVRKVGYQHAHRKHAVQRQQCAQPDDGDALHAKNQLARAAKAQIHARQPHILIHRGHHQVFIVGAAQRLLVGHLHALHAAQRFQQMRLLARGGQQLLLRAIAQGRESRQPQPRVQRHRQQRHQRQLPAVHQHQRQRHGGHQAVNQRFDKARAQGFLNGLHRTHARSHIAHMALFKKRHRQPQQMGEHPPRPLQPQAGREMNHRPPPQKANAQLHQQRQPEAQPQYRQQITVGRHQNMVHHPLHIKGRQHYKHLQGRRKQQHLRQRSP